ncbi:MAG: restriction endonuclease subunit S [Blastocatellia bacterium]|nr:restriction endonuclease subunit S [Blastocatellia bacterium]
MPFTTSELFAHFDRIADALDAIPRLRHFILNLAVRGKLVEQDLNDEPVSELLKRIQAEKVSRVKAGTLREQKPLPPITESDTEYDLPKGWQWVRMAQVVKLWNGYAFKSRDFQSEGVPVVRIGDLQGGEVVLSDAVRVPDTIANAVSPEVWIPPGALLIAMSGATTGKVAFNRTGLPLLLNQRVGRIEVFLISTDFIRFFFETIIARNLSISFGTAIPNLSALQINETVIPLPPLAEQHRIVAKVDELMALCDRLEAAQAERERRRERLAAASLHRLNNGADATEFREHARFHLDHLARFTTRPDQIPALRQTILNLAVRGQLVPQDPNDEPATELLKRIQVEKERLIAANVIKRQLPQTPVKDAQLSFQLPDSWRCVRFGELITDADAGWSPKSEGFPKSGDNWGVLKVSAVSWDKFLPEENKQLLPGVKPPEAAIVRKDDFLISRANTSELVAKCVIVEEQPQNLILSDKIVRLQIVANCNKKFLCIVNNHAEHARSYYAEEASGTSLSMKNVSRAVIYALAIPLPPLAEQHRIVAKVEELLALCDQLEAQLTNTQTERRRLLESVLHEALAPTAS